MPAAGLEIPTNAQCIGLLPEKADHVRNVLVQRKAEFVGTLPQILARHAPRERLVLHPLDDRRGFQIEHAALITPNVLDAMANQGERYRALIDRKVPRFARGIFYHYAGVEGTPVLDSLRSGELVYMHRVMVKPG